jgi:hypothetical protein
MSEVERKYTVFQEAGRGRKKCGGCEVFVGVRTNTCPQCGHVFQKSEKSEPVKPEPLDVEPQQEPRAQTATTTERPKNGAQLITIPAGRCPVPLPSSSADDVLAWSEAVREKCRPKVELTTEALQYWVRDFFGYGTPDHRAAVAHLAEQEP